MSQCVPVPKSGDLSNPNKWRGVMLMDVMSKIFSSILNGMFKCEHGSCCVGSMITVAPTCLLLHFSGVVGVETLPGSSCC